MSIREQLNSYIEQLERRLRLDATLRGAAILTAAALITTVILVLIINLFAFSKGSVAGARVILLFAIVLAAGFGLAIPLSRLTRRRAVGKAEDAFPQFQQRLVTFAERDQNPREPFLELLAADTLEAARGAEPALLAPNGKLLAFLGAGIASLGILVWMILAGPGYLGYGAALLWASPHKTATPFYDIQVTPGDATVRRNADQLVTALPVGVQTDKVRLYARYQSTSKWEQLNMQPQQGASGFQFLFAGLPEGVEYYIEAGAVHSPHFNLHVVDMPGVKQIKVTYRYPSWTGLQTSVEERGGDLRAVEGTDADLEILMDRPLNNGLLVLDNDHQIQLSGGQGNLYKGSIHMDKDGTYHIAALDRGQPVRLSEDFFVEANKAKPPEIAIDRPSRDYRASPIEEVTVAVKASDEFGLTDLALHYSVNGGPEKTVDVLKQKGQKETTGSLLLSLEDFKMVPGDIVSVYATAKDAQLESRTDMYFIQADPFEREFSQSQQGGGGGGGGGGGQGNEADISQREKEIIATTWQRQGNKTASKQDAAEAAKFLSEVQTKLAEQALSLANRMQSRELSGENAEFNGFVADMNSAAQAMGPASDKLKQLKWNEAIPSEQKALQYLLRAEATFRQIQVAFGNSGGGGGGGGGAGRDLASLFDLELDTEKNQYETGQTASSASQREKDIDDALKKLDDLARREEELAQQQRNSAQNFQQRWQQEMLRREAEELQKQMQQLAQNGQQGQQGSSSSSGQSSSGQSSDGQSSNNQSQSNPDQRAQQALDRLKQAGEDMRRAASGQEGEAEARRAADRLREATNLLGSMQQQQASGRLDSMAQEAGRLSTEQRAQEQRMEKGPGQQGANGSFGQNQSNARQEQSKLADDRQRLSDDLSRLEKQMRGAERELAPQQRDASSKLRDALGEMDQNDLETRVQRSADLLRRGNTSSADAIETEIGGGLKRLSEQLRQAQQALGSEGQQGSETALSRVERLRDQLQALDPKQGNRNGQGRQTGQTAQNGQPGQRGGVGQLNRSGQTGEDGRAGDTYGGGDDGIRGPLYGNYDTGNNSNLPQPVAPDNSILPSDPERAIQQGVSELNQLQQSAQNDPETIRDIQDLIREMQQLDPKRFPGNPALVEQLHTQVLSDVDKLELQLRRTQGDKDAGQVRSTDPLPVPSGYQDAVAEYFRRLSKHP
jgi:hypothetical protein